MYAKLTHEARLMAKPKHNPAARLRQALFDDAQDELLHTQSMMDELALDWDLLLLDV